MPLRSLDALRINAILKHSPQIKYLYSLLIASRLGSKSSGTSDEDQTQIDGGSLSLITLGTAIGILLVLKATTCPRACTPVSVLPEPIYPELLGS
ncbi:MAG: hypothetical protein C00003105_00937 [ANME-2 cluster archaeon HR1]|nr:MAG: hypothetical protein C00003105_00937 [ANME-2 cluster archaeon HR1]